MAQPGTRRGPPPDPPDTGNRISIHKTASNRPNIRSKSTCTTTISIENIRKAEVIEKALDSTQNTDKEIPLTNDIQMDDPFISTSPTSGDAPPDHTINTSDLSLEVPSTCGVKNSFALHFLTWITQALKEILPTATSLTMAFPPLLVKSKKLN